MLMGGYHIHVVKLRYVLDITVHKIVKDDGTEVYLKSYEESIQTKK
jgi:hypothetical protein